jgi:hypothetical protein
VLNKIFILAISSILVSCSPKSTPESEALLSEIHATQSKTKVGINYQDYSKVAQELQVKLDNFERSENSKKLTYAGNIVVIAENYIKASDKDRSEDWSPQFNWKQAGWSYQYMQNCQSKSADCYSYDDKFKLSMDLLARNRDEIDEALNALKSKNTDN